MNDPWTPYGGIPRGVDPVGAVPGVSGWMLVIVGLAIVGMGVVQLSVVVDGVTQMGLSPTDASLVGLIVSFLPLIGAFVATFGATQTGQSNVLVAVLFYFWPYLLLLSVWGGSVVHAKRSWNNPETPESEDE